jgi:hypothetical protein
LKTFEKGRPISARVTTPEINFSLTHRRAGDGGGHDPVGVDGDGAVGVVDVVHVGAGAVERRPVLLREKSIHVRSVAEQFA